MAPDLPIVALSIAGSDSGGGAGIQADLKTFTAMGCFGTCAITAVTAQNTLGVQAATLIDPQLVTKQIASVADDLLVAAAKTGMLGSAECIEAVALAIREYELTPLVVDPVMIAKSGDALIRDDAVAALIKHLLPLATVVTPNRHEAARLLGTREPISSVSAATMVAERICTHLGARACVVKGIRRERHHQQEVVDVFFDGLAAHELAHPWHDALGLHGSGCAFSAAITAALAQGQNLHTAMETAKQFIHVAILGAAEVGHGTPPVNPLAWITRE